MIPEIPLDWFSGSIEQADVLADAIGKMDYFSKKRLCMKKSLG